VVERLRETREAEASIARLSVYANRGATKIVWDGERHAVDAVYGERHQLGVEDAATLRRLLESLGAEFDAEVRARREWYAASFPRFDFTTLPPRVDEREGAVLVLRPIPARRHAATGASLNPRAEVCARGLELLRRANLDAGYELAESGRSSIEITRRGVSKKTALGDLLAAAVKAREAAGALGETARGETASGEAARGEAEACVESALVYVGDEFEAGGNDAVIARVFPRALCLSVAPGSDRGEPSGTVVSLAHMAELGGAQGTAATHALLTHLLNLSA
jgi:hypothetical protein